MTDVVTVKLSKSWGPHASGASIEVDEVRAAWLDKHGYVAHRKAEKVEKPKGKKRH